MTFATPIHTSEQSIDRVLKVGIPVMLVFWKRDSQPCKELERTLSMLAVRFEGRALIAKVNTEENSSLVERYKIDAVPSLLFIRDGEEIARGKGAASEQSLSSWLSYLAGGGERPALPSGPADQLQAAPAAGAGDKPLILTDATFDAAIRGPLPVLVDFWAAWCGPCKMIAPSVEQLAREFAGRAVVAKLNIDENPRTAQRLGIMSIPTLYVFKNGRPVDQIVGAQPIHVLRQTLARHVA